MIPVILGTDAGAYGLARSFHEYNGTKAYALGREALYETRYSDIVEVHVEPDLLSRKFPELLLQHAKRLGLDGVTRWGLLLACSDAYVEQVVRHRVDLEKYYILPFCNEAMFDLLIDKFAFYRVCDEHGIAHPKTYRIDTADCEREALIYAEKLGFPLVLKPNHSISYGETSFPGKRKAYHIESRERLVQELEVIAKHYRGAFLLQEYIPGDDTEKWVLHALSNTEGEMVFQSQARMLVEDPSPVMIGTAGAFLGECDRNLAETFRRFLNAFGYVGLSCIDLKYDVRDGRFKVLEMNMRLGRNAYFVTGRGYNLAQRILRTFVPTVGASTPEGIPAAVPVAARGADFEAAGYFSDDGTAGETSLEMAVREHLWLDTLMRVVLSQVRDSGLDARVRRIYKEGNFSRTLSYRADFHLIRWFKMLRNQLALAKRLFRRN